MALTDVELNELKEQAIRENLREIKKQQQDIEADIRAEAEKVKSKQESDQKVEDEQKERYAKIDRNAQSTIPKKERIKSKQYQPQPTTTAAGAKALGKQAIKKTVEPARKELVKYKTDLLEGREARRQELENRRSFFYDGGRQTNTPRKPAPRSPAPRRAAPRAPAPRRGSGTILSGVMGGRMNAARGGNIGGSWNIGVRTPFKQSGGLGFGNNRSGGRNILSSELNFINPLPRGTPAPARRGNNPLDIELGMHRPVRGSSFLDKMFAPQKKKRGR